MPGAVRERAVESIQRVTKAMPKQRWAGPPGLMWDGLVDCLPSF